jgi:integrase
MRISYEPAESLVQSDRVLHHQLTLTAYKTSFKYRNLTERYQQTEFRRLQDVFTFVSIGDEQLPTVKRPVDTFDLINPYQAAKLRDTCFDVLPNPARFKACMKAVDRYCWFLKENPTIYLPGQQAVYLPDVYGPIESPVNCYTIPRCASDRPPNRNFLEASEYKTWLRFTWSQIKPDLPPEKLLKVCQTHLMCVLAGETGMRLQELLGLELQHLNLIDDVCLVTMGKRTRGSDYRKREVSLTAMAKASIKDFVAMFPKDKTDPVFQNIRGQRLGKNTAHHWLDELIQAIKAAGLPILIDKGFGWHAFRRTFTRLYLERGGNIFDLKRNNGWRFTSTISHYLCDSKQTQPTNTFPLHP